jgi:hypothetical protein
MVPMVEYLLYKGKALSSKPRVSPPNKPHAFKFHTMGEKKPYKAF